MMNLIKRPLVTEKNTKHQGIGTYVFEVDRKATKKDIRSAVEKAFDVKVLSVRTMICRNRIRRTGTKLSKIKYWKKALIKTGEKIALFEGT